MAGIETTIFITHGRRRHPPGFFLSRTLETTIAARLLGSSCFSSIWPRFFILYPESLYCLLVRANYFRYLIDLNRFQKYLS